MQYQNLYRSVFNMVKFLEVLVKVILALGILALVVLTLVLPAILGYIMVLFGAPVWVAIIVVIFIYILLDKR